MARRNSNVVYRIKEDLLYKNEHIEKLINVIMRDGKKSVARKIVYGALHYLKENVKDLTEEQKAKTSVELTVDHFMKALENVSPLYEVVRRRVGGATYPVPTSVKPKRSKRLAMQFLKKAIQNSSHRTTKEALAHEIYEAYYGRGGAVALKDSGKKNVDSNMVYAHYNRPRYKPQQQN